MFTSASPVLLAAPGDLDTTFGGGFVEFPVDSTFDFANSVAVLPDGRVLAAGESGTNQFPEMKWVLAKRTVTGAADASFGGGSGQVLTEAGLVQDTAPRTTRGKLTGLVVQNNGTITASGCALGHTTYNTYVARWHADGSPDTSFGTNGQAFEFLGFSTCATTLVYDRTPKLIVGGYNDNGGGGDGSSPVVMRYDASGHIDPTFGTGGIFQIPASIPVSQLGPVGSITIQPDNKIVVAVCNDSGDVHHPVFMRLKVNGTLDTTFGSGGVATLPIETDCVYGVTILPDGKIVAAFSKLAGASGVVRLTSQGALDTSFNGQGWVDIADKSTYAFAVLPTGQMLLSGIDIDHNHQLAVTRVTAAGAVDASFIDSTGQSGTVEIKNPAAAYVEVRNMAVASDGTFTVAGRSGQNNPTRFLLARFQGDPLQLKPRHFVFTDVTGVPVSTVQVSDAVEVRGLTDGAYVPILVTEGKYSINGGSFTGKLGYVKNGDLVMVEHTSAATTATSVTTILKIGGLNASTSPWMLRNPITAKFTSTTQ